MSAARHVLAGAHQRISRHLTGPHARELPINLAYIDQARETVVVGVPSLTASRLSGYRSALGDIAGGAPLTFVRCGPASRHGRKTEKNRVYRLEDDENVQLIGLNVGATLPDNVVPKPDEQQYPPPSDGYAVISRWSHIALNLDVQLTSG